MTAGAALVRSVGAVGVCANASVGGNAAATTPAVMYFVVMGRSLDNSIERKPAASGTVPAAWNNLRGSTGREDDTARIRPNRAGCRSSGAALLPGNDRPSRN